MAKCYIGSFGIYAIVTLALAGFSIWHAFHTRKQFFPATIFLTTNKINVVVLSNVAFMTTLSLGKFLKHIFLGELSAQEITELERKGKIAVTETCLALTTFREELNIRMVALFTVLLFVKMFHWLAQMRIENVSVRTMSVGTHIRLGLLTLMLTAWDIGFVTLITWGMMSQKGPSVLLLFAFEFMILSVIIIVTTAKYIIFIQLRATAEGAEGGHTRCCHKHVWMFYLDFTADLLRLFLLLTFFMIICAYYGLPIHLVREIWVTFYGLRDRISKFIRYRRLLRVLDRFPAAQPEELVDTRCTICLDNMSAGVRLPCSHVFHKHCLYTWLFNSQRCPNCVREIPTTLIDQEGAQPAAVLPADANPNRDPAPQAAAGQERDPAAAVVRTPQVAPQPGGIPRPGLPAGPAMPAASGASAAAPRPDPSQSPPVYNPTNMGAFRPYPYGGVPASAFMPMPGYVQGSIQMPTQASDAMLAVCRKQTLVLTQHVEFLHAQLASTLAMLQQQVALQDQLLKAQPAQEMAAEAKDKVEDTKKQEVKASIPEEKGVKPIQSQMPEEKKLTKQENITQPKPEPEPSLKSDPVSEETSEVPKLPRETSTPDEVRLARLQKFKRALSRQGSTDEQNEK